MFSRHGAIPKLRYPLSHLRGWSASKISAFHRHGHRIPAAEAQCGNSAVHVAADHLEGQNSAFRWLPTTPSCSGALFLRDRGRTIAPLHFAERSDKLAEVTFEWDARKAEANLKKHRLPFDEAATVFLDPFAITFPDPDHSMNERREITIVYTMKGYLVFVSHCERGERIRIISARHATRTEYAQYEKRIDI